MELKTTEELRECAWEFLKQDFTRLQDSLADAQISLAYQDNHLASLKRTCAAYERCNESLRVERDALTAELTLAKQATADALHELRSAVAVIERYAATENWSSFERKDFLCHWLSELMEGPEVAQHWITTHAQQTKAPIVDPEAEVERMKEAELEER